MYSVIERALSDTEEARFTKELETLERDIRTSWGCFGGCLTPVVAFVIYGLFTQPSEERVSILLIGFAVICAALSGLIESHRDTKNRRKTKKEGLENMINGNGRAVHYRITCTDYFVVEPHDDELDQYFLDVGDGSTLVIGGSFANTKRFPTTQLSIVRFFDLDDKEHLGRTRCTGEVLTPVKSLRRADFPDENVPSDEDIELIRRPFDEVLAEQEELCE